MEFRYRGKTTRCFLPHEFELTDWASIQPFMQELDDRIFENKDDLERWLEDCSEVESYLSENAAWRYIRMSCDTENEDYQKAYSDFIQNIQPQAAVFSDKYNRKLISTPLRNKLRKDVYGCMLRSAQNAIDLFREENIPLKAELSELGRKYGSITGKLMVKWEGEEKTLQAMSLILKDRDRSVRKKAYEAISAQRLSVKEELDALLDELIAKRNQVARNAGFDNFRDYQFKSLERFDYGVKECEDFHASVEQFVSPLLSEDLELRKSELGHELEPYDLSVPLPSQNKLEPFQTEEELIQTGAKVFDQIHPYFGSVIRKMDELGHFDLTSRKGKAPGGYNYPLYQSNAPFIFMNAVGSHSDLITFMHEGGHGVHSFLTAELKLTAHKGLPSEVAELASMSTELISMEYWDAFYQGDDLKQAQLDQLERVVSVLPWVACVDAFQHWLYTQPNHSHAERDAKWVELYRRFHPDIVNWSQYEQELANMWQKQLHIFEVPFYYIEYGIAQLGAVGVWKNYLENPEKGLENFMRGLSIGAMRDIPYTYERAGVQFDFSPAYIEKITAFISEQKARISKN